MSSTDRRAFAMAAVATAVLLATGSSAMEPCPSVCRYRLCARLLGNGNQLQGENRPLSMGIPSVAIGPFPCIKRRRGFVQAMTNVTGGEIRVAKEFSGDKFVPISEYKTSEITPNFFPRHLRFITNRITGRPTIARLRSRGNQESALDRLCVQMPITSFTLPRSSKPIVKSGRRACVGFRTRVPKLLVDLEWSTSNDFDLRLDEPNGFQINRFGSSRVSPNGGRLVSDNGGRVCQVDFGHERIVYLAKDTVESGEYTVTVDHLRACEPTSRYTLRVYFDEKVILTERGVVRDTTGGGIIVKKFMIPEA